jgi:hypothetical protein
MPLPEMGVKTIAVPFHWVIQVAGESRFAHVLERRAANALIRDHHSGRSRNKRT